MPKARPYQIKVVRRVEGKRAALAEVKRLEGMGLNPGHPIPGIDPKCRVNHFQPGFGGKIMEICPECLGHTNV